MENQKSALGLDPKVTTLVGYIIGLVALIVIFIEKDDKTVRFHAFQSLLYWVVYCVIAFALLFVTIFVTFIAGALGSLIGLLLFVVFVAFFGGAIFFGYKSYQGETFKLPVIGEMAEKWSA